MSKLKLQGPGKDRGFFEPRLFEEPVNLAQNRLHLGRPGGRRRDVDVFAEERGVQRIKTSPKLDGQHGR